MRRARSLWLLAPLLAGLWGALVAIAEQAGGTGILGRLEASLTDLRMLARGPRKPPDIVTIIAIDDETARQEEMYPLRRATLARLIESIADLGPDAIVVDILLLDPGPDADDQALARALKMRPSVIAAAATFPAGGTAPAAATGPLADIPVAEQLLLPLPIFADAAAVGIVNVATDHSGTPRAVPLLYRSSERIETSLPLRAAAVATSTDPVFEPGRVVIGGHTIRTDVGQSLPLSFYGPPGTIHTISADVVLKGQLRRADVRNRVVVIGATVTGGGDVFPTPFDPVLSGVEVASTAISHLMAGDGLVRDADVRRADVAVAVALPMLLVGLLAWWRNLIGIVLAAGVLGAWAGLNFLAFERGVWMSAALPLAAAAPSVVAFGATRLWFDRWRATYFARQSEVLQHVQAPGMAHLLARDPAFLREPVRQNAAVIFVDLSGFTGLSESLGAVATREFLDAFYDLVDKEAVANGGAITSFTGDGAMILFGLPKPDDADAAKAARCCVGLCERLRAWLASLPASVGSRVGFKIGAHFGVIVASRLGHGQTQQIAATGDTVNVASRLMEVAARYRAELAVSSDFLDAGGSAALAPDTLVGPFQARLRGRARPLPVWVWGKTGAV